MKKWTLLDERIAPDGGKLALLEHDGHYTIRIDGHELMSTRKHASEEQLARLACDIVAGRSAPSLLIGGLGFGFTLKAALQALPSSATIVVAEIMEAVLAWNQDPRFPLAAEALADPRVRLAPEDVGAIIARSPQAFDAILLDVDNGPTALSRAANSRLYDLDGIREAKAALRAGGVVAYWSAGPDQAFEKRLEKAGLKVRVERARAHSTSGGWHTLFLGSRP